MEPLKNKEKIEGREVDEVEFIVILKKSYMKTTSASEKIFKNCEASLKAIFKERKKVAGKVTVGDANLIAESYSSLDQVY